jgi:hypothetical protein
MSECQECSSQVPTPETVLTARTTSGWTTTRPVCVPCVRVIQEVVTK